MVVEIREDARCLKCGYRLHGLPNAVCPECARAFVPDDPSTFDDEGRMLRRTRKRRRAFAAVARVLIVAALFPHGTFTGQLQMQCSRCGFKAEAFRWEFSPPKWIPVRYPGWTKFTTIQNPIGNVYDRHGFDAYLFAQRSRGVGNLSMGAARSESDGNRQFVTVVNGVIVTRESAAGILKDVMSPSARRVVVQKQLVEP